MTARVLVASDTWGVGGANFLRFYLALVAAVLLVAVVLVHRHRFTQRRSIGSTSLQPVEVAMLGGGDRLALAVALIELRRLGLLDEHGVLGGSAEPDADVEPVTRAVHAALASTTVRARVDDLIGQRGVVTELRALRARLHAAGLLQHSDLAARRRIVEVAWYAVVGLGFLAFLVAGSNGTESDDGSAGALFVVLILMVAMTRFVVGRPGGVGPSLAGRIALRDLRRENEHLRPAHNPSWTTYGARALTLSAALFGAGVVLSTDPAFGELVGAESVDPSTGAAVVTRSRSWLSDLASSLGDWGNGGWGDGGGHGGGGSHGGGHGGGHSCGGGGHGGGHGCGGGSSCGGGGGCGG